ncbi:rhomboid family intramembrane serine protease [Mesorhizobium sp. YIM 152430]|uniref:rhomboid family intramembrane serine protease n=1 Tax=Mesorhizobium sp. YIM 152430 TaxID=3031761 RepID=UPI0023DAFC55|nr:rhomboid family intramembrane serine protease [Mesorhizobium sp. YIM 152430]MDF1599221.1 rhomboid family intramembrane serine protease [Mesorhizobium sp. YIM 152430]
MFIPLHDANRLRFIKAQYVTVGLIAVNVIAYFWSVAGGWEATQAAAYSYGYIPSVAFDHVELPPELRILPGEASYVTYAFLHGDLLHLGGNMLFLWVFGDNVEDAMGHLKFFVFYIACAVAGAWLHGMMAPTSEIPLIGASGAVAGIVSAYLLLHPRVKIWVLVFGRLPLRIPAWIVLALWIGFQFVMFALAGEDQISWAAHIGGILAGAVLLVVLKRSEVPLLDRRIVTPQAAVVASAPADATRSRGPWHR